MIATEPTLDKTPPLLKAESISKSYGSIPAVRSVSLAVYPGEVFGIVGESGSGKSTLVRILNLEERADSGDYRVDAAGFPKANLLEIDRMARKRIRNERLGIVYQNPHLGLRMNHTSSGNIASKLLVAGERQFQTLRDAAQTSLEASEFPIDRMDDLPARLSGGMQQRVQLAKAIAMKPALLFLDEPTSGLDVSVQAKVLDTFKRLQRETRITIVLVSHDLGVIRAMADRVMVMRRGQALECGLTDQVLEDPQHPYTQSLVHSKV